jgi:DNA repair exonuclease SbcCD ATPase subunit
MDIKEIKLLNFLSHQATDYKFSDGLLGIVGHNGSGKSSFIKDAVTWCLWGKSRSSGAGDDLIHENEDMCTVKVQFVVNNIYYIVQRNRHKEKRTELKFVIWNGDLGSQFEQDLTRATVKDTQEEINKVLGMTYEVFKNSCCIEQGEADSFSNLTPKEAADVLLKILQLDRYNKYKLLTAEKFFLDRQSCDRLIVKITALKDQLEMVKVSTDLHSNKTKELESLDGQYKSQLEKYKKSEEQHNNIKNKISQLDISIIGNQAKIGEYEQNFKDLESNLLVIKNDSLQCCPICDQAITSNSREKIKEKKLAEMAHVISKREEVKSWVHSLEQDKLKLQGSLPIFKLTEKALALSKLDNKIAGLKGEILVLLTSVINVQTLTDEIAALEVQKELLESNIDIYSELNIAFSSKGIPLLIIDNVLKELEVLINTNLQVLTDLPISVEIKTQKESLQGELLDTFQISINDGLVSRPYFNYSGGEKMLIDLAIRLGLSELLARRNNFKVETLIIDEGLGSLDESNQVNFFKALMNLQNKFKKILVITHTEVKEYFPKVIEFKKEEKVSKLLV